MRLTSACRVFIVNISEIAHRNVLSILFRAADHGPSGLAFLNWRLSRGGNYGGHLFYLNRGLCLRCSLSCCPCLDGAANLITIPCRNDDFIWRDKLIRSVKVSAFCLNCLLTTGWGCT